MDNYYNLYMKYKNKYLTLQNKYNRLQIGGANIFDNIPIEETDVFNIIINHIGLAIYIPEKATRFLNILKTHINRSASNLPDSIDSITVENMPKTLEEIASNVLHASISEEDRLIFINMYSVPFMSTNKTLKTLYGLNPEVMKDIIDELIKSKRMQYMMNTPPKKFLFETLVRTMGFQKNKELVYLFNNDLKKLTDIYKMMGEEQEKVISAIWVEKVMKQPGVHEMFYL